VESPEFADLAVRTITTGVTEPEKHEALIERSRAHTRAWVEDAKLPS
jgi:hypothetical protein